MGLFRRSAAGVKVTLYEGKVWLEVVGESSYQDWLFTQLEWIIQV